MHGLQRMVGGSSAQAQRAQLEAKSIYKPIQSIQQDWCDHVNSVVLQNLKTPQKGHMQEFTLQKQHLNAHFKGMGTAANGVVSLEGATLPFTNTRMTRFLPENKTPVHAKGSKENTNNLSSATWNHVKVAATTLKQPKDLPSLATNPYKPTNDRSYAPGPPESVLEKLPAPKRPEPVNPMSAPPANTEKIVTEDAAYNATYQPAAPIGGPVEPTPDLKAVTAALPEGALKAQQQPASGNLTDVLKQLLQPTATGKTLGRGKSGTVRKVSYNEAKRKAAIGKLVREKHMTLGEASAYIKKHGIPSDMTFPTLATRPGPGDSGTQMTGGYWGTVASVALPLLANLLGKGKLSKEAHDSLAKEMERCCCGSASADLKGGLWGTVASVALPLLASYLGKGQATEEAKTELTNMFQAHQSSTQAPQAAVTSAVTQPAQKAKRARTEKQRQRDAKMKHLMKAKKMKMAEAAAYLKAHPEFTVSEAC